MNRQQLIEELKAQGFSELSGDYMGTPEWLMNIDLDCIEAAFNAIHGQDITTLSRAVAKATGAPE